MKKLVLIIGLLTFGTMNAQSVGRKPDLYEMRVTKYDRAHTYQMINRGKEFITSRFENVKVFTSDVETALRTNKAVEKVSYYIRPIGNGNFVIYMSPTDSYIRLTTAQMKDFIYQLNYA